ncbi:hypothetical protein DYB37_011076 [Aphanomyces astaci]|uniref:peptidylprolyl isomerase n=1 Tax=Aphanomyces astaci TaxID=112090 RepID=A0A3L6V1F7_APHAT|nr:hypothetical protein DYB37_011076 [Aphanomyces astaci]RLO02711.1 hypothetical protein DYB28_011838 [Aphanomyces astaci]
MSRFHGVAAARSAPCGFMQTRASAGLRFMSSNATRPVKFGDQVSILIEGRLSSGEIFDEKDTEPQKFIVGDADVIPGLEEGLLGMIKGQTKVIVIPPELAFGPAGDESDHVRISKADLNLLYDRSIISLIMTLMCLLSTTTLHLSVELVGHVSLEDLDPSERLVVPHEISPGDEETYPEPGDTLAVHYEGWLTDGTLFDSSRKRGKPFEFIVGNGLVIKGWDEGMLNMSKGEKARLYIPAAKGYGAHGAPPTIPPNSDLIFEVELIQIKKNR